MALSLCVLNRISMRKFLLLQAVVYSLLLLCSETASKESKKKGGKSKIKRKYPDDPFLPEMIVFSLDHTLWPFAMEMIQMPVVTTSVKYQLKDRVGRLFNLFPDVPDILEDLDRHWYKIAGLCDNSDIRRVENTTSLFDIDQFFNGLEAQPGNKTEQIQRLSERAKVPLENILYYDTNQLDLEDMKAMNVTTVILHPSKGLTYAHLEQGFRIFRQEKENPTITTTDNP